MNLYVFFLIQKVQLCGALSTHDIDPLRVDTKQRDHWRYGHCLVEGRVCSWKTDVAQWLGIFRTCSWALKSFLYWVSPMNFESRELLSSMFLTMLMLWGSTIVDFLKFWSYVVLLSNTAPLAMSRWVEEWAPSPMRLHMGNRRKWKWCVVSLQKDESLKLPKVTMGGLWIRANIRGNSLELFQNLTLYMVRWSRTEFGAPSPIKVVEGEGAVGGRLRVEEDPRVVKSSCCL